METQDVLDTGATFDAGVVAAVVFGFVGDNGTVIWTCTGTGEGFCLLPAALDTVDALGAVVTLDADVGAIAI